MLESPPFEPRIFEYKFVYYFAAVNRGIFIWLAHLSKQNSYTLLYPDFNSYFYILNKYLHLYW
jgi:hypothetical protein